MLPLSRRRGAKRGTGGVQVWIDRSKADSTVSPELHVSLSAPRREFPRGSVFQASTPHNTRTRHRYFREGAQLHRTHRTRLRRIRNLTTFRPSAPSARAPSTPSRNPALQQTNTQPLKMGSVFGKITEELPKHEVLAATAAYEIRKYAAAVVAAGLATRRPPARASQHGDALSLRCDVPDTSLQTTNPNCP